MLFRLLTISLLLFSCQEEIYYRVDPRLTVYVESFYTEGAKYGQTFGRDNLIMGIKDLDGIWGLSLRPADGTGQITVWIDPDVFLRNDSLCTESIVFHELGHALLRRDHKDYPPSLMRTDNKFGCYPEIKVDGIVMEGTTREELIKELFTWHL